MQTVISSSRDDCYQVHVTRREAALVAQWNAWAHQADVTPFQTRRWLGVLTVGWAIASRREPQDDSCKRSFQAHAMIAIRCT
jgi:hypothetical protein